MTFNHSERAFLYKEVVFKRKSRSDLVSSNSNVDEWDNLGEIEQVFSEEWECQLSNLVIN